LQRFLSYSVIHPEDFGLLAEDFGLLAEDFGLLATFSE
jgi:hypothetical protein